MNRSEIVFCPYFRLYISKGKKRNYIVDCMCDNDKSIFYCTTVKHFDPSRGEKRRIRDKFLSICTECCPKLDEPDVQNFMFGTLESTLNQKNVSDNYPDYDSVFPSEDFSEVMRDLDECISKQERESIQKMKENEENESRSAFLPVPIN